MPDVNIGAVANDGTGDPLRIAFSKLNQNDQTLEQNLQSIQGNVADLATTVGEKADQTSLDAVADDLTNLDANSFKRDLNFSDIVDLPAAQANLGAASDAVITGWGFSERRIPQLGESLRLDFAANALGFGGGGGGVSRAQTYVAMGETQRTANATYVGPLGSLIGIATPIDVRREYNGDVAEGAVIEPYLENLFVGEDLTAAPWTVQALRASAAGPSPVDGENWTRLEATAGGTGARRFGQSTNYQSGYTTVSAVLKAGAVRYVMLSLGSNFVTPSDNKGLKIVFDLVDGVSTVVVTGSGRDLASVNMIPLGDGAYLCSVVVRAYVAGNIIVAWYPMSQFYGIAANAVASDLGVGDEFYIAMPTFAMGAAPMRPLFRAATRYIKEADGIEIDVGKFRRTGLTGDGAFECIFHLHYGSALETNRVIPILRTQGASPNTQGFGLQMVGRTLQAVASGAGGTLLAEVPMLPHTGMIHAIVSFDGNRLSLLANGTHAEVYGTVDISSTWSTLKIGAELALGTQGLTVRPFAGIVNFVRHWSAPVDVFAIYKSSGNQYALELELEVAPGESKPVFRDGRDRLLMEIDYSGAFNFRPATGLIRSVMSGGKDAADLPDDAFGFRSTLSGLIYSSDEFGSVTRRYIKHSDGFVMAYDRALHFEMVLCAGQSLAGAHTYGSDVPVAAPPFALDVRDGTPNSQFNPSSNALITDRLVQAYSSDLNQGGITKGFMAAVALERIARNHQRVVPMIGKTISQGGARINEISKWGLYDEFGVPIGPTTNVWDNTVLWHENVKRAVDRLGGTVSPAAILWVHGTSDANRASYYADLLNTRIDHETLIEEVHGTPAKRPWWIMTQSGSRVDGTTSAWNLCDIQLEFCMNEERAIMGAPLYAPDYEMYEGNVHPTFDASTRFSEVLGHAYVAVEAGEKWNIGVPEVTLTGDVLTLDFSEYLRHDEEIMVAPDTYYNGEGIDAGAGIQILDVLNGTAVGPARWGDKLAEITAIEFNATTITMQLDRVPTAGTQGLAVMYARQIQDMSSAPTTSNLYAHRGLIRTTWERPSFAVPGRMLHRWVPSFRKEYLL